MDKTIYSFPAKEELGKPIAGQKKPEVTFVIDSYNRDSALVTTCKIDTSDEDKFYQLVYDDNTTWMADGHTLQELFGNATATNRGDGSSEAHLPLTLETGAERGIVAKIALKLIHVFIKPAEDKLVKTLALKLESKQLEASGEGLKKVDRVFGLSDYKTKDPSITTTKPILLFIHGTNSNAVGAFGGLLQNTVFGNMYDFYTGNVLAFQHRTLTQTPLQNTIDLVKALPDNATLHIISHSRGGLIGEVLSKYAAGKGFVKEQLRMLQKEDRTQDLADIAVLEQLFKNKKVNVEKFVRVASPSAGTLLASDRMDHILNVLFNIAGAGFVGNLMQDLIGSVLKEKDNLEVLPGLEAMNPSSPFIKALNARIPGSEIDGSSLIVISGNGKLSMSFRGLTVLLGKLFYLQRSDLVVNTDSMYLGVSRSGSIQYFFDEGANVDHVHYFNNPKTQNALFNALKTAAGKPIAGYKSVAQLEVPASDRGALGLEGGQLYPNPKKPSGKKPVVVLLPGIMGSNIYDEFAPSQYDQMWLDYWGIIKGDLSNMTNLTNKKIKARSVIKSSYNKLYKKLSETYDVVIFPFDWRKSMKDSAAQLSVTIEELLELNVPIKMVGHSMGGVLARDFIVYHNNIWQKLNARKGFRLLFLGSPLNGSHRIPAVLFGMDAIINKLSFLDIHHSKKELVSFFTQLPGILSLLPFTEGKDDYANPELWAAMRKGMADKNWPLPPGAESPIDQLTEFAAYRDKVLKAAPNIDYSNMTYIAGQDNATPCGYSIDKGKLVFDYTREGDQSVTWASGIPKQLIQKEQVYYAAVTHGALANEEKIFGGIEEILSMGDTNKLSKKRPVFRDADKTFRIREHTDFDFSESGLENTILGITPDKEATVSRNPLTVSVSHGDLSYSSFPVLAGHFNGDAILQAEKAIDLNLNSILQYKHGLGGYPGAIGTYEVIYKKDAFFEGAIIVGLGDPEKLTSYMLAKSIATGVANYLLGMHEKDSASKTVGISALLIGTGYGKLSIDNSVKAIIEGVNSANATIASLDASYPQVTHIEFIEQYEDYAIGSLFVLRNIESTNNTNYNIIMPSRQIKKLFGCRKTLPVQNTEDWWNRLSIRSEDSPLGKKLIFSSNSGDARNEVSELYSSTSLTDSFLNEISIAGQWSDTVAKTLFELLIPNSFKDQLKRKGQIIWILDKESAAYPWELLQDSLQKARPLCIDGGMVRQLSTMDAIPKIEGFIAEKALIVADPELTVLPRLDQARAEGEVVKNMMESKKYAHLSLIGSNSGEIVKSLYSDSYKILHFAGHGIYNPADPKSSGIVIGDGAYLTPAHIQQLPYLPELVFINCCHLGAMNAADDQYLKNKYGLAANIGTQLIEMGVKAVVVAGWQVADDSAKLFAEVFYEKMFGGETFGNAVKASRQRIYDPKKPGDNTWGAYQCYGDPYYKLMNRFDELVKEKNYIIEDEVYIDLNNLLNKLDVRNTDSSQILQNLSKISEGRKKAGLDSARINEMEAMIYNELGMYDIANIKFEELKQRDNAGFSMNALEKYFSNLTYKIFEECLVDSKDTNEQKYETLTAILNKDVIANLENLQIINPTAERSSLIGSAYKRMAFIAQKQTEKRALYEEASGKYFDAYKKGKRIYPLSNYLIFETILDFHRSKTARVLTQEQITEHFSELDHIGKQTMFSGLNMDYWDNTDYTSTMLALLFLDPERAKDDAHWDTLMREGLELRKKFGSPGKKKAERYNFLLILDALQACVPAKLSNPHGNRLIAKISEMLESFEKEE